MSTPTYLKVAIVIGNAIVFVGSFALASYIYKTSQALRKESQRLKKGGATSYDNLAQALSKVGEEVLVSDLSFSGKSLPIKDVVIKSNISDKQYLAIKVVTQESNKKLTQTTWVQQVVLEETTQHRVQVKVPYPQLYSDALLKDIIPDNKLSGKASLKELFSFKISEKGIAFGSNLYVFGKFLKNKHGQIVCEQTQFICDAANAQSEINSKANQLIIGVVVFGSMSLACIGLTYYFLKQWKKEQETQKNNKIF